MQNRCNKTETCWKLWEHPIITLRKNDQTFEWYSLLIFQKSKLHEDDKLGWGVVCKFHF